MKHPLLIASLCALFLINCSKEDDLSSASRNVVSNSETVEFEELLLLVNVNTANDNYLVVNSIDSINIFINNYYWAKINSQAIDTAHITTVENGNQFESPSKVNYFVTSKQDIESPDFTTAGEFAEYLNSGYDLKPGEYVCFIESFQVTFIDNTTKTYYPHQYMPFKVEDNSRSVFVGEFNFKID